MAAMPRPGSWWRRSTAGSSRASAPPTSKRQRPCSTNWMRSCLLIWPHHLVGVNVRLWHKGEAEGGAKPLRLCPCSSDVNLFCCGKGIIDLNAQIPDGALDLCMSQQQLHGAQVAGSTVDERRLGASKGVRAEEMRVQANRCNPARYKSGVLPSGHAAVVVTTT